MKKPKVIIIGGGFGGLNAAKSLKKADVEIFLFDKANHHLFQPLLYQVATAALSPGDIAAPIREILANQKNASVFLADIIRIDTVKNLVITSENEQFVYDFLILAPGARHSYFSHPDWEMMAPGLKTLSDAIQIRERILLSYEKAEMCRSKEEAMRYMQFIIIGGGPTGVEMAGAISEIARKTLVKNFRNIRPEQTKVYLIEGTSQVLPTFPKDLGEKAKKQLEHLGVEVLLNSFVTQMNSEGIFIGNRFIESQNIIWAAGNKASTLLQTLDVPLDNSGRVIVEPDLSIPNHENVFVIGDAANIKENNIPLPGIAPVAIQQGRYVAKLIANAIQKPLRKPFKYFDKGMMATIGKEKAVVMIGKIHFSGFFAWVTWCFIHIAYLISFPHKLLVMMQWFYLYLFNKRRVRLITRSIDRKNSI